MKTFFRWLFRICVALFILVVALAVIAVLLKDVILKSLTERNLRNETGMDAKIEKFEFGLATPTVNVEGLKMYNTEDFGGGTFLEMPELRIEYVPEDMQTGKVRFKTLRLNLSEVHIVKNKSGRTNIEMMHKAVSKNHSDKEGIDLPGIDFAGVDTIYLKIGKIKITDEGNSSNNAELSLGSKEVVGKNFKTEKEIEQWFQWSLLQMAITQAKAGSSADQQRWQKLLTDSLFRSFGGKR